MQLKKEWIKDSKELYNLLKEEDEECNLIDIYVQEVTKRLPEKNREDITLELTSTIEDMLPDDYNEE